ncbi:translation initiation factor IF-2, partial [Nocardioides sp.]
MDPFLAAGVSLAPLEGGWSGETFLAEAGGERTVVRIFADPRHHPAAAEIGGAVLRLVRGLVPVPQVKEVRRASAESGMPALLITEFVPGVRGDLLLPTLDDDGLEVIGAEAGRVAATLAGMPTLRPGVWADGDLRIEPRELGGLAVWVEQHLAELPTWPAEDVDRMLAVAESAQELLDTVDRSCVVHSDLNPKNLLLDPDTLTVAAVVDWEFSHSGHPFTDLGNLLRFDRLPAWVDGVVGAWCEARGVDRDDAVAL